MNLPGGAKELKTVEEVKQAWGDLFIIKMDVENGDEPEEIVAFADDGRVAISHDGVFVKLRKPITAGQDMELTDVLLIREPTVNDIRLTEKYKGEVEKSICLLSALCTIPQSEVGKMTASDLRRCGEVLQSFL